MTILDEILEHKRREVDTAMGRRSPGAMRAAATAIAEPTRGFRRALEKAPSPAIIAEIKRRSPSKGVIRADFDPAELACAYAAGGAAALSVLTDERYFGGHLDFVAEVREVVPLPLLRKEFIVDTYQIDEARAFGADAILLIVSALAPDDVSAFARHAGTLDLDVLVEVHDEAELEVALGAGAVLVGVNNRDLKTFDVDLGVTERLAARLPVGSGVLLVSESGIAGSEQIARLEKAGAKAFLVGESLMREADVTAALKRLRRIP